MKNYLLLLTIIASLNYAVGQEDELIINGTIKINRQLTPPQVIDSLYKIFPKAMILEYYQMPAYAARNGWTVAETDSLVSYGAPDCYLIIIKRGDLKFYSLFSAEGLMVMTKLRENVTELPPDIKASLKTIQQDYPGYKVRSTAYYKNQDRSRHLYYEIIAERGTHQQRFFYELNGTLVKSEGVR